MPKLKWNDCSSSMTNIRAEEGGRLPRKMNTQHKYLSLGKGPSDRKWVDYSNSKIFIKKRPNQEYNILRQVLSRDKQLAETLNCGSSSAPSSPSPSPQSPSSPPLDTPHKNKLVQLSVSCPELDPPPHLSSSSISLPASTACMSSNYIIHSSPSVATTSYLSGCVSYQQISPSDSFYLEIQPLPLMDGEIYNYAWWRKKFIQTLSHSWTEKYTTTVENGEMHTYNLPPLTNTNSFALEGRWYDNYKKNFKFTCHTRWWLDCIVLSVFI